VVALKRQEAQAVGYKESPYDALLDEYEPGMTAAEVTRVFVELRSDLVPLVAAIGASGKGPRPDILTREYPVDRQHIFGEASAALRHSGSTSIRGPARLFPERSTTCRSTSSSSRSTRSSARLSGSRPTRRPTTCTSCCASSWRRRS